MAKCDLRDSLEVSPLEVVTHARDVEIYYKLDPTREAIADLTGLISRVNPMGGIAFFRLRDSTGSIQLVADSSKLPADLWECARRMQLKDRVRVRGPIDSTSRGTVSVIIDELDTLPQPVPEAWEIKPELRSAVTTQFLLARLRTRASQYLQEAHFEEFEPSCLTISVPQPGIEPLEVVFRGFGVPVYLVPSPAPELLAAILATGYPKVFSVSRCFSAAIRDGYTSAESLILCVRQLDATITDMHGIAESLVKSVFAHYSTMPERTLREWLGTDPWPIKNISEGLAPIPVCSPEVQVLSGSIVEPIRANTDIESAFRVCWPPRVIVAEGHVELLDGGIRVGGLTVHLERMVTLLQEVTLRRLRDWGPLS